MALEKPASIASSPYKSAKWDELTEGRCFDASSVPSLMMLIHWYEVFETAMDDISGSDGVQLVFENAIGDIKAFPQLGIMKQASAEIRALNKQLGITSDEQEQKPPDRKDTVLHVTQADWKSRANAHRKAAGA